MDPVPVCPGLHTFLPRDPIFGRPEITAPRHGFIMEYGNPRYEIKAQPLLLHPQEKFLVLRRPGKFKQQRVEAARHLIIIPPEEKGGADRIRNRKDLTAAGK